MTKIAKITYFWYTVLYTVNRINAGSGYPSPWVMVHHLLIIGGGYFLVFSLLVSAIPGKDIVTAVLGLLLC